MNQHTQFKIAEDYIPLEIQAEIMKRLPVESLIRFTSISKSWNSLIRSSKFIRDCHAIQLRQPLHRLLIRFSSQGVNKPVEKYVSIVDDDTFPKQKLSMIIPMSVKQIYNSSYPTIVCSSHGLLCFYNSCSSPYQSETKRAVIWNPTIRKSVDIDLPMLDTSTCYNTVIGFGVCPCTSDPKLVKITWPVETEFISTNIEVFTLKSGFWRSPRSNLLPHKSIMLTHKQVVIDEFIYWLAYDSEQYDHHLIISFDMISEEFVELHLPESLTGFISCLCISKLNKLKESLVVVATSWYSLRVWIMQNGDPKSFTPVFTINPPIISITDVLGFRVSGEPIFVNETRLNEDELFVYEPNSKYIKSTRIFGELKSFSVCSYTETLLLLDH